MFERLSFGASIIQVTSDLQRQFVTFNRLVAFFQSVKRTAQTGKRTHFVPPSAGFARELQILLIKLYDLMLHLAQSFQSPLGVW